MSNPFGTCNISLHPIIPGSHRDVFRKLESTIAREVGVQPVWGLVGVGKSTLCKTLQHTAALRRDQVMIDLTSCWDKDSTKEVIDTLQALRSEASVAKKQVVWLADHVDHVAISRIVVVCTHIRRCHPGDLVIIFSNVATARYIRQLQTLPLIRVPALSKEDVTELITTRLKVSGAKTTFSPEACKRIFVLARGRPGLVNNIARLSLFEAEQAGSNEITAQTVGNATQFLWTVAPASETQTEVPTLTNPAPIVATKKPKTQPPLDESKVKHDIVQNKRRTDLDKNTRWLPLATAASVLFGTTLLVGESAKNARHDIPTPGVIIPAVIDKSPLARLPTQAEPRVIAPEEVQVDLNLVKQPTNASTPVEAKEIETLPVAVKPLELQPLELQPLELNLDEIQPLVLASFDPARLARHTKPNDPQELATEQRTQARLNLHQLGLAFDAETFKRIILSADLVSAEIFLKAAMPVDVHLDASKKTALHKAVALNNPDLVSTLIRYGADPTRPDVDGLTSISMAQDLGFEQLIPLFGEANSGS